MFIWCRDSCYSQAVDITIEEMPSCGVVLSNAVVSQLLAVICVDGTSVGCNSNLLKKWKDQNHRAVQNSQISALDVSLKQNWRALTTPKTKI